MVLKSFNKNGMYSRVQYSSCMKYRYSLSREWCSKAPKVLFLLLNPSTANEEFDDPTIIRCRKRALALGFGSIIVCNLFALRSKYPKQLLTDHEPIGPENDKVILAACNKIKSQPYQPRVICGWGTNGVILGRADHVKEILVKNSVNTYCLG